MRDHRKLKAFQTADLLVLEIYRLTVAFPRAEMFGLTAQLRRGAVSVVSNIVEGCARRSVRDYAHFIDIALAAAKELAYQLSLAERLHLGASSFESAHALCEQTIQMLCGLQRSLLHLASSPQS